MESATGGNGPAADAKRAPVAAGGRGGDIANSKPQMDVTEDISD